MYNTIQHRFIGIGFFALLACTLTALAEAPLEFELAA